MKLLVVDIVLNSLYSIILPFTWQSALSYPQLPPSSVIGLLANALQRYENKKSPKEYLKIVEKEILWAGSRMMSPCVIKSYTMSAIVKWEDTIGGKFTNALGRQFAFSTKMQIAAIFNTDSWIEIIEKAILSTPLTCGDSESCISVCGEPSLYDIVKMAILENEEIETDFPFPFDVDLFKIQGEGGKIFLVHERCGKTNGVKKGKGTFPLVLYMFPLKEENGIMHPGKVKLKLKKPLSLYHCQNFFIIPQTHEIK